MQTFNRLIEALEAEGAGALVSIVKVDGSSPRESGTRMVVRPSGAFNGTIGGGQLAWQALAAAQEALAKGRAAPLRRIVLLGPDLAQCCGGRVEWLIETFDTRDAAELGGGFCEEAGGGSGDEEVDLVVEGVGFGGGEGDFVLAGQGPE